MHEGIVHTWDDIEGVGWISVNDTEIVWVHFTGIKQDEKRFPNGFRFLVKGQRVTFDFQQHNGSDHHRQLDGARVAINVVVKDA